MFYLSNIAFETSCLKDFRTNYIEVNCCTYVVPKQESAMKLFHNAFFFTVVWGGIEPPTQGFSVLCSTD